MDHTTYLLIGSGVAGSHAAKELRQQDPQAAVTLVTNDPHRPYDRPPLSKDFLRGEMSLEKVFFDDASFYEAQKIELNWASQSGRSTPRPKPPPWTTTLSCALTRP